jgi:hypothetical protein
MPAKPKCPVCNWEIKKEDAREVQVQGRTITVCCDDCAAKVKAEPAKYAAAK